MEKMYFRTLSILFLLLRTGNNVDAHKWPRVVNTSAESDSQAMSGVKCDDTQGSLSLNLRNAGLQEIGSNFANSPNVTCLSLEDNKIDTVSTTAFQSMPNLLYLNLARNKLDIARFAQLDGHAHLRILVLDKNAFPPEAENTNLIFANEFPSLLQLHLREIGIEDLSSLGFAPKLTHLYISSNKLAKSKLSFLVDVPMSLEILDLAYNGLRGLNVSTLRSVKELNLDGNRIERLCGKCRDSSALTLEGASILRRLSLSRNALTSIEPDAFDKSEYLLDLDLSYNRIDSIRKNTFERTPLLRNLSLKSNFLREMPDFYGSENLEYFSLGNNLLEVVKNESFADLFKLRSIDLSNNKIGKVQAGAFAKLNLLEFLDLSNNKLTSFPSTWLVDLTYLRNLRINGNRLKRLYDVKLNGMRNYGKLERVYLQNNFITEIHAGFLYNSGFRNIPNVTLVLFDANDRSGESPKVAVSADVCNCEWYNVNEIKVDEDDEI